MSNRARPRPRLRCARSARRPASSAGSSRRSAIIDFWFVADGKRIHKTVHHFLLLAEGGELSDADVEVTEVAWVPLAEVDDRLAYEDERRLVKHVPALLADIA